MKKLLTIVTLGGLFTAGTAQAQINFYITGATAFRANAYRSIRAMYVNQGGALTAQNPADPGASSANMVTFAGTMPNSYGSQVVTIRCSYSGSAAGVQALVQNPNLTFLANASPVGDTNTMTSQADLAFSDVFQSSTPYQRPALNEATVGVQPFSYVRSVTTPATVTNITIQQLQAFQSGGVEPLSYFTGNSADDATLVYFVGRDSGSGTRVAQILDSIFVGNPLLWAPDSSCNWNVYAGFSSGSGIVGVLNGTCGPAIGYMGIADAKNVAAGANILSYDGVKPFYGLITAPDWTPIKKGLYSFWSYEHLYMRTGAPSNVSGFRTALKNEINTDLATSTSAIQVGAMKVSRAADGGPISP
jgi:hypothetical protein